MNKEWTKSEQKVNKRQPKKEKKLMILYPKEVQWSVNLFRQFFWLFSQFCFCQNYPTNLETHQDSNSKVKKKFEKLDTTTASVLSYRAYEVSYFKLPILYSRISIIHLKILIFSLQNTKISMQYFNDKLMPTLFQICIRVTIAR